MKQVPNPPFLGIVSDKKWSPFLDLGVRSPIFLHPISLKKGRFSGEKYGTSDTQTQTRRPLFVANYPKNWWTRHLIALYIS